MSVFQRLIAGYAPWYFRNRVMGTLVEAVGAHLDEQAARLFQGQINAIPYCGGAKTAGGVLLQCSPDALPWHARDRGIKLYPTEPIASRRWRLSRWHQLKRRKGSHRGCMENLQPYFLGDGIIPAIQIIHQDGAGGTATWHKLDGAGVYTVTKVTPSNWNYDGQTAQWSRWWLIIDDKDADGVPVPAFDFSDTWDGTDTWDDPPTVWDGLSAAIKDDLVAMAQDWKAAHSVLQAVILNRQLGSLTPTTTLVTDLDGWTTRPVSGNWGSPVYPAGTGGGLDGLNTRPPYLSWLYDRNYV